MSESRSSESTPADEGHRPHAPRQAAGREPKRSQKDLYAQLYALMQRGRGSGAASSLSPADKAPPAEAESPPLHLGEALTVPPENSPAEPKLSSTARRLSQIAPEEKTFPDAGAVRTPVSPLPASPSLDDVPHVPVLREVEPAASPDATDATPTELWTVSELSRLTLAVKDLEITPTSTVGPVPLPPRIAEERPLLEDANSRSDLPVNAEGQGLTNHAAEEPGESLAFHPLGPPPQERTADQIISAAPPTPAPPEFIPRPLAGPRPSAKQSAPAPLAPATLASSGVNLGLLSDLVLKQLYLQGPLLGVDIARNARLPFNVVEEGLIFLKDEKCLEVQGGDLLGRASYRHTLTDLGRLRAREAFEQCRYVGPAPVSLEDYVQQCALQTVAGIPCDPHELAAGFRDLVLSPQLLEELGPALCSGRSIFLHGPPGNGKTVIAKRLAQYLNLHCGEIYVPYAILCESSIITLYDPSLHTATDDSEILRFDPARASSPASHIWQEQPVDLRWRRIRRPVIATGGELTLDMLELRYNATANFYQAPLHVKANGGVFLIDDFGRQLVSPRELLNRWILPLEERTDFLTLATGKKFSVPFEQLIIFSTNLDPRELVDEAFLRRMRHKINIATPDRTHFTEIFRVACGRMQIQFSPDCVDYLFSTYYDRGKPARSSDPRDLLEIVQSICRFRHQELALSRELIAEAARRFFCKV